MPLDLIKRSEVTSALTADQYDQTMTAIEAFVNALETSLATLQTTVTGLNLSTITGTLAISKGGTASTTMFDSRAALQTVHRGVEPNDLTALWRGTQAQYDAIATKHSTTLYVIVG